MDWIHYTILVVILVVCLVDSRMKKRQIRDRAGWVDATAARGARY